MLVFCLFLSMFYYDYPIYINCLCQDNTFAYSLLRTHPKTSLSIVVQEHPLASFLDSQRKSCRGLIHAVYWFIYTHAITVDTVGILDCPEAPLIVY
jgi:hypothetical protein